MTKRVKDNPFLLERRKERIKVLIIQIIIFIGIIVLWEWLAEKKYIDTFLFSRPSKIYQIFLQYLLKEKLMLDIGISVFETIIGLILGTFFGLLIAIILWWNKTIARIFDPFLVVLNALPKTALAPILIIWAGTGIRGITVVAMSISLVLTILTAYAYFIQIEEDKIKMLRSFKASKWQILTKLVLPSNVPNLVSIVKINIGMSWVGVIVGEFIVSRAGIGYLITYGSQVFNMHLVMMGVFVLAIIAFIMYEIVHVIEKKFKSKRG